MSPAPTDASFRAPPWVVALGRLIDRLGVGPSVAVMVSVTLVGAVAIGYWMLRSYPPEWMFRSLMVNICVAGSTCGPVSFVLCRLLADVSRSRTTLRRIAHVDALTLALTRGRFMERAPALLARPAGAVVIILDIDHFKRINDGFGHPAGDAVLRAVSETCRSVLREGDLFARLGGEEFVALMPDADLAAGTRVAERMREQVAALDVRAPDGRPIPVTASFGVARPASVALSGDQATDQAAAPQTLARVLEQADQALYRAKENGRDRIEIHAVDSVAKPAALAPGASASAPAAPAAPDLRPAASALGPAASGLAPATPTATPTPSAAAIAATPVDQSGDRIAAGTDAGPARAAVLAAAAAATAAPRRASPPPSPESFRSPRWIVWLGDFVERVGLLQATLCSVVVSTIISVIITMTVMFAAGMVHYGVGLRFALTQAPIFSSVISWCLFSLVADVARARTVLRQIAHIDALTQAHTRRYFMDAAPAVLSRSRATAVVLFDIDNFKSVNDRHGHATGDAVLRAVSAACRSTLRPTDLFARYGGEEFVAVLPGMPMDGAGPIVERMRQAIAALELRTPAGEPLRVTASFGIAQRGETDPTTVERALEDALGAADRALYEAKHRGKNRIEFDLAGSGVGNRLLSPA